LKRDVKDLNKYVELLDKCIDKETVVNLIQEIVLSIIDKKELKGYKGSSYSFASSEDSNSVEIIEVRERKAISHK